MKSTPPLKIKEAAAALAISTCQVRALIRSGDLVAFDVSAKPGTGNAVWRIDAAAIESFRESRRVTPPAAAKKMIRRNRRRPSKMYV